jgi:hypothetical protein
VYGKFFETLLSILDVIEPIVAKNPTLKIPTLEDKNFIQRSSQKLVNKTKHPFKKGPKL